MHPLLQGLAAGDRNGGPIRMALLLYQSLESNRDFVYEDVLSSYRNWFRNGAYDTGATLVRTFLLMEDGYAPEEAVRLSYAYQPSDGVAPAHRASPIAIFLSGEELDRALYQEAKMTHFSEISAQVSIMVGRICSLLLQNLSLEDAIQRSKRGLDRRVCPMVPAIDSCSAGGYAPDVLASALAFLLHYDSFEESLCAALTFAGSANYCPVLVGAIGGCLYGGIPASLMQHDQTPAVFQT
ncbi:MAG: ADP-ribosylglycohydrolase family protein [Myxococcota bacterium]|nr:ADP-ribosylglycohydrolase family protein [Myxococcota bacterium]